VECGLNRRTMEQ